VEPSRSRRGPRVRGAMAGVAQINRDLEARSRWCGGSRITGAPRGSQGGVSSAAVDPAQGRSYYLDPRLGTAYDLKSQIGSFCLTWLESGAAARPYRCFCGSRHSAETLVAAARDRGTAVVLRKGRGTPCPLALCPLHQQYVTVDLLKPVGVRSRRPGPRAKAEAEEPGTSPYARTDGSYLVLGGEGVSSLVADGSVLKRSRRGGRAEGGS